MIVRLHSQNIWFIIILDVGLGLLLMKILLEGIAELHPLDHKHMKSFQRYVRFLILPITIGVFFLSFTSNHA